MQSSTVDISWQGYSEIHANVNSYFAINPEDLFLSE